MKNIELYNDNFQNWKRYQIPKAQLIIADVPYNLSVNAYASNPSWYVDGDNRNGESDKAYGNAIVPQVAYEIFKAIQETYNQ